MPGELPKAADLVSQVFSIRDEQQFLQVALSVFRYQYHANLVYQAYCRFFNIDAGQVKTVEAIPFLPISFFKTHNVQSGSYSITPLVFESSGTTGVQPSRHFVQDASVYEESFRRTFNQFYGNVQEYSILALLPSYLERGRSSLVYMVDDLIRRSGHPLSGFYLYDFEKLAATLRTLEAARQKTILFGVTYALLDFAEKHAMPLRHTTLIETGGMKGRKKELLRAEVHHLLKEAFQLQTVQAEYGMTEAFSQAYATQDGRFFSPPWMHIQIRQEDDPLSPATFGAAGGINIIDLANVHSCAFIATEDVGRLNADGSFEVIGRLDHAEVRGCSLLAV